MLSPEDDFSNIGIPWILAIRSKGLLEWMKSIASGGIRVHGINKLSIDVTVLSRIPPVNSKELEETLILIAGHSLGIFGLDERQPDRRMKTPRRTISDAVTG